MGIGNNERLGLESSEEYRDGTTLEGVASLQEMNKERLIDTFTRYEYLHGSIVYALQNGKKIPLIVYSHITHEDGKFHIRGRMDLRKTKEKPFVGKRLGAEQEDITEKGEQLVKPEHMGPVIEAEGENYDELADNILHTYVNELDNMPKNNQKIL